LGKPWPKHACFFDDGYGIRLRSQLAQSSDGIKTTLPGVVAETVVIKPGETGRIVVQCSDGRVIDDEFATASDLTKYPGSLVVVEEREPGKFWLHRVTGNNSVIEVWDCPKLGQILVYDPDSQQGVKETESRFYFWREKRWNTLCDFNIQLLLVPLDNQEMSRIAQQFLQDRPAPPPSKGIQAELKAILTGERPWSALRSIFAAKAPSIPVVVFAGTSYERRFFLPGVITPERAAKWVTEFEAVRRPRRSEGAEAL
jgi:hypothetical protein